MTKRLLSVGDSVEITRGPYKGNQGIISAVLSYDPDGVELGYGIEIGTSGVRWFSRYQLKRLAK